MGTDLLLIKPGEVAFVRPPDEACLVVLRGLCLGCPHDVVSATIIVDLQIYVGADETWTTSGRVESSCRGQRASLEATCISSEAALRVLGNAPVFLYAEPHWSPRGMLPSTEWQSQNQEAVEYFTNQGQHSQPASATQSTAGSISGDDDRSEVLTLDAQFSRGGLTEIRRLKRPASESVGQLKEHMCEIFSADPNHVMLHSYHHRTSKYARLDDSMDSSLTALGITESHTLLLEEKEEAPSQDEQEQPDSPDPEAALLNALLDYMGMPAQERSNCPTTIQQLAAVMDQIRELLAPCSRSSDASASDGYVAHRLISEAIEQLQQLQNCVVCLDAARSVMLLPCKHLALCADCSEQLAKKAGSAEPGNAEPRGTCPVCRAEVEQHVPAVILS